MRKPDDRARLHHMRDAAQDAIAFAAEQTRADLDHNRMLAFALIHAIEIVGEAAARLTKETQVRYPEVPWSDVIGMRHRLAHGYYDVNLDRVWDTVKVNLPPLIADLDRIIDLEFNDG